MQVTVSKFRLLLFGCLMLGVIACAYWIGSAAGYFRGFQLGSDIAKISAANMVVAALEMPANDRGPHRSAYLDGIVDDAFVSYRTMQNLGASQFDTLGVNELRPSIEDMMNRIRAYRRKHPRSTYSERAVLGEGADQRHSQSANEAVAEPASKPSSEPMGPAPGSETKHPARGNR